MEQLIPETIFKHMKKMVIRSSQQEFIKDRKCLTNMIAFYSKVTSLVYQERVVEGVYFSFSKAFDTVSHNILIEQQNPGMD